MADARKSHWGLRLWVDCGHYGSSVWAVVRHPDRRKIRQCDIPLGGL